MEGLVAGVFVVVYAGMLLGRLPRLQLDRTGVALLLLPVAVGEQAGLILALSSSLAGNLLIIGSIANIIVIGLASADGIHISWRRHAALGVPVTLATLALAGVWLAVVAPPSG